VINNLKKKKKFGKEERFLWINFIFNLKKKEKIK